MQGEHRELLILYIVGTEFAMPSEMDKIGALHLAQFQERAIGGVLYAVARKAAQNLLCLGSAQTQRGGKFDHLIIPLPDELPFDGAREDRLQVGIGLRLSSFGPVQLLRVEIFQAGQQLKAQQRMALATSAMAARSASLVRKRLQA